ncbi:YkyA family protein [Bacillus sp. EKM202B]|uniref:YkyA family protein n=1 Tax=Bacillus sp. EKM202B TaxID=1683596 RepID=UPI0013EEBDDD|nr:YkyA family protein [Bacillus sp. EKM202B]KAF6544870.1 YkyA family protein [Bacillus sp. EKM202B]
MINRKAILIGILSIGFLGGCLGAKPEEKLYVAFEKAANQEKALSDNVKKLEQLEAKGQELYNQIIQKGQENNEEALPQVEQAVANVSEREKELDNEADVLEKAQKEVTSVLNDINKIEDEKLQEQAKTVEKAYKKRYDAFLKMNGSYKKSLIIEKELYEKLKEKETKLKEISEKVKAYNVINKETLKEKEKFNQYTTEYNKEKLSFYKAAKIKIKEQKPEK